MLIFMDKKYLTICDHKRARKPFHPCRVCGLNQTRCICQNLSPIHTQTRFTFIIHHKELKRTSNTGILAHHCLTNSSVHVRGEKNEDRSFALVPNYDSFILSPDDSAKELTPQFLNSVKKPMHIYVPDGNWRQASKVSQRYSQLKDLPKIKITPRNSQQKIFRKEHFENGLSTMLAVIFSLEAIEGISPADHLKKIYELKLQNTLDSRGVLMSDDHA